MCKPLHDKSVIIILFMWLVTIGDDPESIITAN